MERKATPEEVDEYRRFVLTLANRVAAAHKEGFLGLSGERVSEAEEAAVAEIAEALGTESPWAGYGGQGSRVGVSSALQSAYASSGTEVGSAAEAP